MWTSREFQEQLAVIHRVHLYARCRGDPGDHGQDHDPGEIVVITLVIIVPIFTDVPGT
jgi:hypothetical protein